MIFETEVVPWSWPAKNYVSTPPNLPCMVDIDKVCYVKHFSESTRKKNQNLGQP